MIVYARHANNTYMYMLSSFDCIFILILVFISQDNCLVPDLRSKIVTWVRNHAYIGTSKRNLKVRIKSSIASKDDMGAEDSDAVVMASELDIPDVVPVKLVPPRRRTKSSIRILKDNKVICSS